MYTRRRRTRNLRDGTGFSHILIGQSGAAPSEKVVVSLREMAFVGPAAADISRSEMATLTSGFELGYNR